MAKFYQLTSVPFNGLTTVFRRRGITTHHSRPVVVCMAWSCLLCCWTRRQWAWNERRRSLCRTSAHDVYIYKLCHRLQVPASDCCKLLLQEPCVLVTTTASRRHLRSAARGDLQVLFWTKNKRNETLTDELSLSGLTVSLRVPPNFGTVYHPHSEARHWQLFGSRLKTHLFCLAYERAFIVTA